MVLDFISNLPEKFRNIICEIQELPTKKPKMFQEYSESKKKTDDREWDLIVRSLFWMSNLLTTVQYYTCIKGGEKIVYV